MQSDFDQLGKYLKEQREVTGLSQAEVAKKLGYTSPQFVSNWERGLASPPADKMREVVRLLKLDEDRLLKMLCEFSVRYWTEKIKGRTSAKKRPIRSRSK